MCLDCYALIMGYNAMWVEIIHKSIIHVIHILADDDFKLRIEAILSRLNISYNTFAIGEVHWVMDIM